MVVASFRGRSRLELDLLAFGTLRDWGWYRGTSLYKVSPCERDHCGGTLFFWAGDDVHCLLCARSPDEDDRPILVSRKRKQHRRRALEIVR